MKRQGISGREEGPFYVFGILSTLPFIILDILDFLVVWFRVYR